MGNLYITKEVPLEEESKLIYFLDKHWKKHHSIVASRTLLFYQHLNENKDGFHFIVGENTTTNEYDALVGYIPTSQYDSELASEGDYWGAIWKIRDDIKNSELNSEGFYVWKRLFKLPNFKSYAAIGISDIAKQIYIASRLKVDSMNQYYIVNKDITDFKISKNLIKGCDYISVANWKIKTIYSITDIHIPTYAYKPFKSKEYFKNRYELHPFYKYLFWGIYNDCDELINVWVLRRIIVNNTSILRIVDVLGEIRRLPTIYKQIQTKLREESCEYIDFMNYGLSDDIILNLGFQKLNHDQSDIVCPNYFEPFLRENIRINLAYKAPFNYVAFKGDSDQDRPNIL